MGYSAIFQNMYTVMVWMQGFLPKNLRYWILGPQMVALLRRFWKLWEVGCSFRK
jgi:hypothetical protein